MKNLKGEILKALERKGLSQDLLINSLGLSRSTFYNNLDKGNMKLQNLEKMFQILDIEPNEFFEVEGSTQYSSNVISEPVTIYGDTKADTGVSKLTEIEFLRLQLHEAIQAYKILAEKIDTAGIR